MAEDRYDEAARRAMESPEARQAREYEAWELSDEGLAAQDAEIAPFAREHGGQYPAAMEPAPLEIDTSDPAMGAPFEAALAALDVRLAALRAEWQEQDRDRDTGLGY